MLYVRWPPARGRRVCVLVSTHAAYQYSCFTPLSCSILRCCCPWSQARQCRSVHVLRCGLSQCTAHGGSDVDAGPPDGYFLPDGPLLCAATRRWMLPSSPHPLPSPHPCLCSVVLLSVSSASRAPLCLRRAPISYSARVGLSASLSVPRHSSSCFSRCSRPVAEPGDDACRGCTADHSTAPLPNVCRGQLSMISPFFVASSFPMRQSASVPVSRTGVSGLSSVLAPLPSSLGSRVPTAACT